MQKVIIPVSMAIDMEDTVPDKLEEWVAYEDQKRLEEWNVLSHQYCAPDYKPQTWRLLGTPTIEPSYV
ncbi:hypothetical protein [Guptibacillus spartinae]|uniref:hypothetical protein n=1 Tax=Guptibacillus spartinae TaxID=3025679 RepID=UPI00235FB24B|nr:hypothetical protein [Pseudalkalibacillus spartinae]